MSGAAVTDQSVASTCDSEECGLENGKEAQRPAASRWRLQSGGQFRQTRQDAACQAVSGFSSSQKLLPRLGLI